MKVPTVSERKIHKIIEDCSIHDTAGALGTSKSLCKKRYSDAIWYKHWAAYYLAQN